MSNDTQPEIRFPGFTDDWEQRKFKEFSKKTGKKNTKDLDFPAYSVSNKAGLISQTEQFDGSRLDDLEKTNYKFVEPNEFAYNPARVNVGSIAFNNLGMTVIVSSLYVVVKMSEDLDNEFILQFIKSPTFIKEVKRNTEGSVREYLFYENFANIKFPFTRNKEEQQKIGSFFKQLDNTITLQQRKLDLLKETKKGFLQKMFPKNGAKVPEIRFPGFTEDWEERKLGDMMDVTSVKRIHQSDWTNSGIRFLRARDIVSAAKNEEPSDYLYISEEKYNEYSKISGKVSQGDLLVTGVGSIGVPLLITDDNPIYFKDGNIIWFKNEHKIDGNFFYYSFINNKIQKYIRDVAGIGTVGTYTIDSGKKTPISLPTYDEQIKIGSFFKQFDHTIMLHQHELDLLKETKKGFLQKMFV